MNRGVAFTAGLIGCSLLTLVLAKPPASQQTADYVGSEACAQCHAEQHAEFQRGPHGRAEQDQAVVADRTGCESCHGPGSLHVAAGGDRDDPGFHTVRDFRDMPAHEASEVCAGCHRSGEQFHWKHSAHAREEVACVQCHSIHHAQDLTKTELLKARDVNALCLQCHKSKRHTLARSAHMPLLEGGMDCADCHNPHGAPAPRMLRAASVNELCEKCHMDKRGPFLWEHPPVRENCTTCHEPHGSNQDKVLSGRRPYLCQKCHIATRHPSTLYDRPDLASNRLFNRSCTNCHSQVHGSNHPSGRTFLR